MAITAKYFHEEPLSKVIGPQLGPSFDPCGVRITIAFPDKNYTELHCQIFDTNGREVDSKKSKTLHPIYKSFLFEFESLEPNEKYFYKFVDVQESEIDLEGGLTYQDCWFNAPTFKNNDKIVLLSCNNPFHSKKQGEERFAMWQRLLDVVNNDKNIKLLVQGGDQVYHDDIEADCLQKLKKAPIDEEGVQKNIIKNYQHYYSDLSYRKIMASVPSVAMLDDHDITDGWGGRPSSFKGNDFKPEWQEFFNIAYDAFKEFQTLKNPKTRLHGDVETTYLDFGDNRIYLLDLRKEKNINDKENPLLSPEHENRILSSLEETPDNISNILILSPVVPVRINPVLEETLGFASKCLYQLRAKAKIEMRGSTQWAWAWRLTHWFGGLGGVADLTDDINDGLSSSINRRFLITVLKKLSQLSKDKNKQAYIVSGDIHTGGISEIFVRDGDDNVCIPQIVSSPIGYEPMKKIAKDKTTEESDYKIVINKSAPNAEQDTTFITARNIFYRSNRNFAVMQLANTKEESRVSFYFEKLERPVISQVSFY